MLLSPDERRLYVTLANRDAVAVIDTAAAKVDGYLDTRLPGQQYGGGYPQALAQSADGKRLFVADGASDSVAVFDMDTAGQSESSPPQKRDVLHSHRVVPNRAGTAWQRALRRHRQRVLA